MFFGKKNRAILGLLTLLFVGQSMAMMPDQVQEVEQSRQSFSVELEASSLRLLGARYLNTARHVINAELNSLRNALRIAKRHPLQSCAVAALYCGALMYPKHIAEIMHKLVGAQTALVTQRANVAANGIKNLVTTHSRPIAYATAALTIAQGAYLYGKISSQSANAFFIEKIERAWSKKVEECEKLLRQKDSCLQEKNSAVIVLVDQLLSLVQAQITLVQPLIDGFDMAQSIVDASDMSHQTDADDSLSLDSEYSSRSEEFFDKTADIYQELLPALNELVLCSKDKKTQEGLQQVATLVTALQRNVALFNDECTGDYHTPECVENSREYQFRQEKGGALLVKLQECKQILEAFKDSIQGVVCVICRESAGTELGELVSLPCANSHGRVIHQECLDGLMQQQHACPFCRELLQRTAPIEQATHEVVHVLAEDGNGYEEIPFPIVPNDYSMAAPTAEDAQRIRSLYGQR